MMKWIEQNLKFAEDADVVPVFSIRFKLAHPLVGFERINMAQRIEHAVCRNRSAGVLYGRIQRASLIEFMHHGSQSVSLVWVCPDPDGYLIESVRRIVEVLRCDIGTIEMQVDGFYCPPDLTSFAMPQVYMGPDAPKTKTWTREYCNTNNVFARLLPKVS